MKKIVRTILCFALVFSLCCGLSSAAFASEAGSSGGDSAGDSKDMSMEDLLKLLEMLENEEGSADVVLSDFTINDVTFSYPFTSTVKEEGNLIEFVSPSGMSFTTALYQPDEDGEIDIRDEQDVAALAQAIGTKDTLNQMDYVTICGFDALWMSTDVEDAGLTGMAYCVVLQLDRAVFVLTFTSAEPDSDHVFVQMVESISVAGVTGETDISNVYEAPAAPVQPETEPSAPENKDPGQTPDIPADGIDASGDEEILLADNEYCAVTLTDVSVDDDFYAMVMKFNLVNRSDLNLYISASDVSVNGFMCDPFWGASVPAGETLDSELTFWTSDFEDNGIETVHDMEFTLTARDDDDWFADALFSESFSLYPNGFDAPQQKPVTFDNSSVVLLENDDCRMILTGFEEDLFYYTAKVYIENNSDKKLDFSVEGSTSLNGIEMNPYFIRTVAPGKKFLGGVHWQLGDLETNGITKVNEVNFDISVSEYDNWFGDPLYTTIISVNADR